MPITMLSEGQLAARKRGREAFIQGISLKKCPYRRTSDEEYEWLAAWINEKADCIEATDSLVHLTKRGVRL